MSLVVANFYKFITLEDPAAWGERLRELASQWELKGTFLMAHEGLNASVAGAPENFSAFFSTLRSMDEWHDLTAKVSMATEMPFRRLLVKVKTQILTFPTQFDPSIEAIQSTQDLEPAAWDEIMSQPSQDVVIVDTRNDYEVDAGKFAGADALGIDTFREFPEQFLARYGAAKDKTYLMYCTGGIRCEKAAAFAEAQGFKNVYKLQGGILAYLEQRGPGQWQGDCFVFDDRETVPPEAVNRLP